MTQKSTRPKTEYNTPDEIGMVAQAIAPTPQLTPEQVLMDQLRGPERVVTIDCSPTAFQQIFHLLPAGAVPVDVTEKDGNKLLRIRLRGWNWPTDKAKVLVADDQLTRVATLVPVF